MPSARFYGGPGELFLMIRDNALPKRLRDKVVFVEVVGSTSSTASGEKAPYVVLDNSIQARGRVKKSELSKQIYQSHVLLTKIANFFLPYVDVEVIYPGYYDAEVCQWVLGRHMDFMEAGGPFFPTSIAP